MEEIGKETLILIRNQHLEIMKILGNIMTVSAIDNGLDKTKMVSDILDLIMKEEKECDKQFQKALDELQLKKTIEDFNS